jgi:2'-5' RNA ligase
VTAPAEHRPRKLRLFFALWPGDAQGSALAAAAAPAVAQVAGRPVPPGSLHVTLAFLGPVAGTQLAPIIEIGGQGPWPAVELDFGPVEYWKKPKVLVALASAVPEPVLRMVERLWDRLEPLGFTREARPWRPHLTLVRHVRQPPPGGLALAPVETTADGPAWRLALVESVAGPDGPRYRLVADWPLV